MFYHRLFCSQLSWTYTNKSKINNTRIVYHNVVYIDKFKQLLELSFINVIYMRNRLYSMSLFVMYHFSLL